jgi:hypothetical protein
MATLATKVATALANLAGAFFYVYLCRRIQDSRLNNNKMYNLKVA